MTLDELRHFLIVTRDSATRIIGRRYTGEERGWAEHGADVDPEELRAAFVTDIDSAFVTDLAHLDDVFDSKPMSDSDLSYPGYLQSEHWLKLRRVCLERAIPIEGGLPACERCGKTSGLQVHHRNYERLGQERMIDLEVLCDACHREEHNLPPKEEPQP